MEVTTSHQNLAMFEHMVTHFLLEEFSLRLFGMRSSVCVCVWSDECVESLLGCRSAWPNTSLTTAAGE